MACWHCGWRNPARLLECELCGKTLAAAPRPAAEPRYIRGRLDVTAAADERPERRTVQNPLFREVMSAAMKLVQGQGEVAAVQVALAAFWEQLQRFVESELPAIVHSTRADRGELEALALEGEQLLRSGVVGLGTLLAGWQAGAQPAKLAQRMLEIQGGLDRLGQCRDMDQAAD